MFEKKEKEKISLALKRAVKKLSRTSLVETFWKNNRFMAFLFMYI